MMPKGVEHSRCKRGVMPPRFVKIPMMPKGVEHFTGDEHARSMSE